MKVFKFASRWRGTVVYENRMMTPRVVTESVRAREGDMTAFDWTQTKDSRNRQRTSRMDSWSDSVGES